MDLIKQERNNLNRALKYGLGLGQLGDMPTEFSSAVLNFCDILNEKQDITKDDKVGTYESAAVLSMGEVREVTSLEAAFSALDKILDEKLKDKTIKSTWSGNELTDEELMSERSALVRWVGQKAVDLYEARDASEVLDAINSAYPQFEAFMPEDSDQVRVEFREPEQAKGGDIVVDGNSPATQGHEKK